MRHVAPAWTWLSLGTLLAACGAGQGVAPNDGGPGGSRDGSVTTLPDGRVVPGTDGGANGDGGTQVGMDGGQTGNDGSVGVDGGPTKDTGTSNGDGSTATGGDGSTSTGGDGSTSAGDGGDGGGGGGGGGLGCGPAEVCNNGLDDNCNGQVDEGCPCLPGNTQRCYGGSPANAGLGVCSYGTQTCSGGGEFGTWGACVGDGRPQPVMCGGHMDYLCDGMIDQGCVCTPGDSRACYDGAAGTSGVGLCHPGTQTCAMTGTTSGWGPCAGEVTPTPPLCDGMDHACNGMTTGGCTCTVGTSRSCYDGPTGSAGVGLCHAGVQHCVAGSGGTGSDWGACTGEVAPVPNTCDGIDRMCTGMPAAGCPCLIGATQACYTGPAGTNGVGVCHGGSEACVAMGSSAGWSSTCGGQVTPVAEICGNHIDDNCNGQVDEGCGGSVVCPAAVTINAGDPVTLTATGSMISTYAWSITSAPTGGASTATWAPAPPTSVTEVFTPFIVGVYTVQVTAVDTMGMTHTCTTDVTAQSHGLRVQLTWDGTGDLDLHVHDATTSAWFTSPDDCYYSNRTPAWGAVLDFDNTTANGPENTRVNSPAVGSAYTIAVHNYRAGNGRIATVQVFCGTTAGTLPTQTFNSRALSGSTAGNCTSSDFWKVARVVFTSATTCTITPIDTYEQSTVACGAF